MALDYFAIASNGYFPTPTPSAMERMSFAGTWGYFRGVLGIGKRGLNRLGMSLRLD